MNPTIQSIHVQPVSFRLISPFVTAAGKKTSTQNLQVSVTLSNGIRGIAEASSSIALPQDTPQAMARVIHDLIPQLRSKPLEDYRDLLQTCWRQQPYHPTAVAALECALLDAYTRSRRQVLYRFLGGRQKWVETDLTLSVGQPSQLAAAARAAARKGFRRFKIKLAGTSSQEDAVRVQAVHKAVPRARLVADGNEGMTISRAVEFARFLEKANVPIVFLEQPFPRHDFVSPRLFRKRNPRLPLVADESVRSPADAVRAFESGAADGVNVKVAKSGLLGALDIIQTARRFKKLLAIGCMEESKLGLAASVHLACGTGAFDWVDLDSVFLLEKSPLRGGFSVKGAKLIVSGTRPGIGII